MNRFRRAVLPVVLALIIGGCLKSVYPLFMERDLVFTPALLGTWSEDGTNNTLAFERDGDKAYTAIYYQSQWSRRMGDDEKVPGDTARFEARLGKLAGSWFLDLYPLQPGRPARNDLYNYHLLATHSISRLWIGRDTLRMALLDQGWVKRMIDNGHIRIPHLRIQDEIVLTASSEELQHLVETYAEDAKAFPKPGVFVRIRP